MAKSKYEYVKAFEVHDELLAETWIVVKVDGKNFKKFSDCHHFVKPNDKRSLDLMNNAAVLVMSEIDDIILAYGHSDEYSFVFDKNTELYKRRSSKILTHVCTLFTSAFIFHWKKYFADVPLVYPPSFDGKISIYPSIKIIRDYLNWRQVDCHINNLYNTTFWALVQKENLSKQEAEEKIRYTASGEKNEMLFSKFGINYNEEPEQFRKGSFIIRKKIHKKPVIIETCNDINKGFYILHTDIIRNEFWNVNPHILGQD